MIHAVDLNPPPRLELSNEDRQRRTEQLVVSLHTLLLIYLCLHNFLIPLVINVYKGISLFTDLHFWWLIHFPIHFKLRKEKLISSWVVSALALGVVTRMMAEMYFVTTLKSWGMFSILISEISNLIFLSVILVTMKPRIFHGAGLFLGLVLPPLLSYGEIRSGWSKFEQGFDRVAAPRVAIGGCVAFPFRFNQQEILALKESTEVEIIDCGFSSHALKFGDGVRVLNKTQKQVSFRLFEWKKMEGSNRWKFKRMFIVNAGESAHIMSEFGSSALYMLRSPELPQLGTTLLFKKVHEKPLPEGNLLWDGWELTKEE